MSEVYQWVTNLLVLVVLMALSDLLVPSTSWRPFIRLVLGVLLLLLLIEPLFSLLQKGDQLDFEPFSLIEQNIAFEQQQGELIIADMNNRHQSYIWNEVADKLARQAGPVMSEQFQLELTDVVVFPNDSSMEQFSGEVEVELKGLNSMSYEMEKNVLNVLAEVWGIPASTIKIIRIGE